MVQFNKAIWQKMLKKITALRVSFLEGDKVKCLTIDEFLRSLKQNLDTKHSFFLGAGASIESGVPSAYDCIWDWKYELFSSQNPVLSKACNCKTDSGKKVIQNWLDNEKTYPALNADEEYSFYAEKTYPIEDDRRKYFQNLINGQKPSLGYHILSMFAEKEWVKSVWTTNFDGFIAKTANQYNLIPIEVTLESQDRIYRNDVDRELLCIALHGDYKYGALKNTAIELDSQSPKLIEALSHEINKRHLIVIGYSGRDKSLMEALRAAYSLPGAGRLYWCGYGSNCPKPVEELIDYINQQDRLAFYIPTDGFDKTMLLISNHCMDKEFKNKVEKLKDEVGNKTEIANTSFSAPLNIISKIVESNAYPVAVPKQCYQMKVDYKGANPWKFCKDLFSAGTIAVPYNDSIYAWGNKESISKAVKGYLCGNIETTPLLRESIIGIGVFKEMAVKAITAILAQRANLSFGGKRIWDRNKDPLFTRINGKTIKAFWAIEISLLFDKNYSYIVLTPSYEYVDDYKLNKKDHKDFSDYFTERINQKKINLNNHLYVEEWKNKLLGNCIFKAKLPNHDDMFSFKFSNNSAFVGVHSNSTFFKIPNDFDKRRIVFNGIECRDPELAFFNITTNTISKDFHPMRGLINNAPSDYLLNNTFSRKSIKIGVICPENYEKSFYGFIQNLNSSQSVNYNFDYVINYPGFYSVYKMGVEIPAYSDREWLTLKFSGNRNIEKSAENLGEMICRHISILNDSQIDVILIYIPEEYEIFTEYNNENSSFDLHNYVKAYAAQKNIATQFIRQKTVESSMMCQIMWALSLAIYVKSCRIPWTISDINKDTAFAGIGYSVNHQSKSNDIVIGCSHIYSYEGQGLKYKLAKISDVTYDKKHNPYLSEDEAFRMGLSIKEMFYKSFSEMPKRVVIHKRTPFKQEEINGFTKSLRLAGINDIVLLEINFESNFRCFELEKGLKVDTFPVRRGLCFPLNDNSFYLFTHGIAPSIRKNYRYLQGGKSLPKPLKIIKYYGDGNMSQIATEILGLSKMNWNSFGLYTKLPCTLESSNEIARIGRLLSQYDGTIYDYRFFM
ncbi:SIR2 family protein [uncultured Ruminococcus sp.]|uniref:SIR2 family protein n=1 Tax=uncultured Ruminococcus sp. TaxID=165186 RepID=UPI0026013B42|nr:SIR2 family protein [uncultured Ruminococcus sp.]